MRSVDRPPVLAPVKIQDRIRKDQIQLEVRIRGRIGKNTRHLENILRPKTPDRLAHRLAPVPEITIRRAPAQYHRSPLRQRSVRATGKPAKVEEVKKSTVHAKDPLLFL